MTTARRAGPARRTQKRGDRRRERLLQAAGELISRGSLAQVTYAAVCARAGLPPSSAHYFYPDLDAIYRALLGAHRVGMDAALMQPLRPAEARSWQAIVNCLIDRAARYHRRNPVGAKLAIGGEAPPQIKRLDRDADRERAGFALRVTEERFFAPSFPGKHRVAYIATELVDTAFMASMLEHGRLTPAYVRLAKEAAIGFLTHYFGKKLRPRGEAPARSPGHARSARPR